MKIIKYLSLVFLSVLAFSCGENIIEYDTTTVGDDIAEFQIHYFVPVVSNTANNIVMIKINDVVYNNNTTPLVPYNGMPSGGVGLFYTVKSGPVNIKFYKDIFDSQGVYVETILAYDKNTTLKPGKQNVFVYDLEKEPVVFENGYPFEKRVSYDTDTVAYVKFYNFLYDTAGKPYDQPLQYQYQYTYNPIYTLADQENGLIPEGKKVGDAVPSTDQKRSPWLNCGPPCAFGETSGWVEIPTKKSVYVSSGYARIDYRITIPGDDGKYETVLQVWNSSSRYISYSDYWTAYVGRHYHHIFAGFRSATPISSVRVWTQL